jgi:hypothetical protein
MLADQDRRRLLVHTVFTIGSRNYLAQGATLMQSLAVADPLVHRILVVSDGVPAGLREDPRLAGVEIREGADFCDALDALAAYYTPIELNTALKPFVLRALLRRPNAGTVTYLDPDITVYRPLDAIRTALETASIALTPHLRAPLPGPASPNDHVILRAGVYNLGFIGVRAGTDTIVFADWWSERCRFDCRVAFDEGLFTDQRWVDLAPGFFDSIAILRSPAFNLAYWSLPGRTVEQAEDGWRVDGEPLVFFHFSGFDPARPDLLSRHQDRLGVTEGALAAILKDYAGRLMAADYRRWSVEPYGFRAFEDGRSITPLMRRALLRRARLGVRVDRTGGGDSLDAIEPGWETAGLPSVTQLMAQAWRELPAAEDRFDRASQAGRLAFHGFFQKRGQGLGADDRARDAAARLLAPPVISAMSDPISLAPWTGPARQSGQWFTAASDGGVERAVVAAWRSNPALRAEFPTERLSDLALVARCVGQEALAGRFDPGLLSEGAWARLLGLPAAHLGALADPAWAEGPAPPRPDLAELYLAFGLSERARWPEAVKARLRAPWIQGGETRLLGRWPRLLDAIWAARPDLQSQFDLRAAAGRLRYLNWFARQGASELNLSIAALPTALRGNPLFIALRLRNARSAPPGPDRESAVRPTLAIVARPSQAPRLPPVIGDAVLLNPETGTWRDKTGGRVVAPRRIKWLVHAGAPDDWAASSMILARQGVLADHVAGLISPPDHALSPADWALGFVDEVWSLSAGVETTIGFRPLRRIVTLDAEAPPLVAR